MRSPAERLAWRVQDGLRGMRFLMRYGTEQIGRQAASLPVAGRLLGSLQHAAERSPIGPLLAPTPRAGAHLSPRLMAALLRSPRDDGFEALALPLFKRLLKAVLARLGVENAYVSAERLSLAVARLREAETPDATSFWAEAARLLAEAAPLRDLDATDPPEAMAELLQRAPNEAVMLTLGLAGAMFDGETPLEDCIDSAWRVTAARFEAWRVALAAGTLGAEYEAVLPFLP